LNDKPAIRRYTVKPGRTAEHAEIVGRRQATPMARPEQGARLDEFRSERESESRPTETGGG
jgi:hypothetical protein